MSHSYAWTTRGSLVVGRLDICCMLATGARVTPICGMPVEESATVSICPAFGRHIALLQSTVASAMLSREEATAVWVAVITAFATAVTSWGDFNGYVNKLDSYTSTVRALESHLSWWQSLSDSEKAGTLAIDKLVENGERFILATRYSRSLTVQEKKQVDVVGVDGAASGKATTIEDLASDNVTTMEGAVNTNQPQASQSAASSAND